MLELTYHFDHKRGYAILKDQLVQTNVEFLDCIGCSGFQISSSSGIVESIELSKTPLSNSMNIAYGDLLHEYWVIVNVRRNNGNVDKVCLHEVTPIQLLYTKTAEKHFISLFKKNFKEKYDESLELLSNDKQLLHDYIIRVQRYTQRKHNSENEFKDGFHAVVRFETDSHPDEDGKIGICRADNTYRNLVNNYRNKMLKIS